MSKERAELGEIAERVEAARRDAELDVLRFPPKSRASATVKKRRAADLLETLLPAWRQAAQEQSVGVVILGPRDKTAAFAKLVEESGEGVSVDASELWERLASSFSDSLGRSREFGPTQQAAFNSAWREVLRDLNVDPDTAKEPSYRPCLVPDRAAAVALARELGTASGGPLPNQLYLCRRAADRALEIRYKESVLPVVVVNSAEGEAFIFGRGGGVVSLEAGEAVDDASVKRVFKEAARQVKQRQRQ